MEIKDFIKDALVQIVDGVRESRLALSERGSYVPTENIVGENGYYDNVPSEDGVVKRYAKVDFDIAVEVLKDTINTTSDKIGGSGEMRLKVAWISNAALNGQGECSETSSLQNTQQNIHRIKFSLPLSLPKSF